MMRIRERNRPRPAGWRLLLFTAPLFALTFLFACGGAEEPEPVAEAVEPEPAPPPPEPEPAPEPPPPPPEPEPQRAEADFWADTEWVSGKEGKLIQGLDGGEYESYGLALVRQVQESLFKEGLYEGPVTGVLDKATMEALVEYQKQNHIQAAGVPTPETRRSLGLDGAQPGEEDGDSA